MKITRFDAMNLSRRPCDVLLAVDERNKGCVVIVCKRPARHAYLNRGISSPDRCARRLKIDRVKDGFRNLNEKEEELDL